MKNNITISPNSGYLLISILIFLTISWSVLNYPLYTFYYGVDFWEHSATIREWTENLWHPGNPHLAIDTGSPRYMPFFFFLTVLARVFDLNPIQALGIGGILSTILFLYGVWLFLPLYFKNDWAAFVGLIVLLCGWGVGWYWSNSYQLRCLLYSVCYPSNFVFSLCFLSFWLMTKILRQREISFLSLISLGIISALMLLCHPLTGAFAIGSLCLLALFEPKISLSHRSILIAVVLAGAFAAELWPYFSVWRVILGNSGGEASWIETGNIVTTSSRFRMLYNNDPFYNPQQFFVALGPGLLGIIALFYLVYSRKHFFIIAGFITMSLPFVVNLIFPIPLAHRFVFYMAFYLHLALIWGILRMQSKIRNATHQNKLVIFTKINRGVLFSFITICLLWNVALTVLEFANYRLRPNLRLNHNKRVPIVDVMRRLSFFIPDESIVMAPELLSWPLPTFTGKVVTLFHENPMVVNKYQRRKDTERFFLPETTLEDRLKILRRYKVTHILFESENISEKMRNNLKDFGFVTGETDGYVIIKIDSIQK